MVSSEQGGGQGERRCHRCMALNIKQRQTCLQSSQLPAPPNQDFPSRQAPRTRVIVGQLQGLAPLKAMGIQALILAAEAELHVFSRSLIEQVQLRGGVFTPPSNTSSNENDAHSLHK